MLLCLQNVGHLFSLGGGGYNGYVLSAGGGGNCPKNVLCIVKNYNVLYGPENNNNLLKNVLRPCNTTKWQAPYINFTPI